MVIAAVLFLGSFIGICILFGIKYWEVSRGTYVAREVRSKADERAIELKNFLIRVRIEAAKIPPTTVAIARFFVHEAALLLARLARSLERSAHGVADFVAQKRTPQRRIEVPPMRDEAQRAEVREMPDAKSVDQRVKSERIVQTEAMGVEPPAEVVKKPARRKRGGRRSDAEATLDSGENNGQNA